MKEPLPEQVAQAIAALLWDLHEKDQQKVTFKFQKFQVEGVDFENIEVSVSRGQPEAKH